MLVITRKEGEAVVIGDPEAPTAVVKLVKLGRERVRVGFEFPADVEVHRLEVAEAIRAERAREREGREGAKGAAEGQRPQAREGAA